MRFPFPPFPPVNVETFLHVLHMCQHQLKVVSHLWSEETAPEPFSTGLKGHYLKK